MAAAEVGIRRVPLPARSDRCRGRLVPALLEALRQGDDRPQKPDEPFWRAPYSFLTSVLYCGGRLTPATVEGVPYLVRTIGEP